jgi:DNA ligase-associated metallophosphoesterase
MTPSSRKPPTSSSTKPCGSSELTRIGVGGLDFLADLTGALYTPDYRALLVADLHFEKGSSGARRGVHLPPYDTRSTLLALMGAVERHRPERLLALGDSFHDRAGPDRLDDADRAAIRRLGNAVEVMWITGNHDPTLPTSLGGRIAEEIALGPVMLRHEPRALAECEIAGHLHPVAAITRRGRSLRRKCFIGNGGRLVMPAFGAYAGGLNVLSAPFGVLFPERRFRVWMIGGRAIHVFPSDRVSA